MHHFFVHRFRREEDRFVEHYMPLCDDLFALAYRLLQDADVAKDTVQDVLAKLWQIRDELPTEYDWRDHRHSLLVSYGTPSVLATSVAGFVWILNLGNEKYPLFVGPVSVEYDYNVLKWLRVGENESAVSIFASSARKLLQE